jgi:endonuclease/exonuclease/phosphatase (EEP) superfamily protein YafD
MNGVNVFLAVVEGLVVGLGLLMAAGTFLSCFSRNAHWFVRGWDFPRPLIAALALLAGGSYALFFFDGQWFGWAFLIAIGLCVGWQAYRIAPYTPLAPTPVQRADRPDGPATLRLVASNVCQDNAAYDRWLEVMRKADPDVILVLEVDDTWKQHIDVLREDYPYCVSQPQDNYYGMMLFSRLELMDSTVRYIVQDDVPSIHAEVKLHSGQVIYFHGVHPRPPEPTNGQHATARDAEVVILGREIDERKERRPTIIAGDFNDVAWSHTTDLFMQLSGLLDPREGRGLYNSFHAEHPLFRFPLDHVFHSNHFKLVDMELLDYVGSDHFPVLIELSYEPTASIEQPEPEASHEEEQEADQKVEKAAKHVENDTLN